MTDQHPSTPPPELVQQWATANGTFYKDLSVFSQYIATQAAQWGADQELEACVEWVVKVVPSWAPHTLGEQLRAARRPKPPTLKEQALDLLDRAEWNTMTENLGNEKRFGLDEIEIIRRALEALDD